MNDTAVSDRAVVAEDLVDVLLGQHMAIRNLFVEVESATGQARTEAFGRLVHLLALHEAAEEEVVHPLARTVLDGGGELVDDRLHEEREAKEVLSRLADLDPDSGEFATLLAELRESVLAHAAREEAYEFRYLRRAVEPARLRALATAVRVADGSDAARS